MYSRYNTYCSGYITILEYIIFLYTYEYCIVHRTERKFNVEVGSTNPAMIIICITDDRGYYARSLLGSEMSLKFSTMHSTDYSRKPYSVYIEDTDYHCISRTGIKVVLLNQYNWFGQTDYSIG